MLATRTEDPQGSVKRTILIQEHERAYLAPSWDRWGDGVPRVSAFNKKSWAKSEVIDSQVPCILDLVSFFTSRPLPQLDSPTGFDTRGLTISDRLNWGKIAVVEDSRTCKLWRIPVFMPEGHKYADPE
eukprot:12581873-Alexandrium_andersonii.AAC.1